MIFLFGIKRNSIAKTKLANCVCPNCSQEDTLIATKYGSYFHFFFIPIFPTGKSAIAECTHCLKAFKQINFTEDITKSMQKQTLFYEKKRPIWHGCGCIVILFWVITSIIAGLFFKDEITKKSNNPLEKNYRNDIDKLTSNPDCKIDSISCNVKEYLDFVITDEMNKSQFKYFSKLSGDKVLILVKIDDMKKIDPSVRKEFIDYIKEGAQQLNSLKNKQFYIGIDGYWNTVLVSTPLHNDLDGKFADETYLYDFYK